MKTILITIAFVALFGLSMQGQTQRKVMSKLLEKSFNTGAGETSTCEVKYDDDVLIMDITVLEYSVQEFIDSDLAELLGEMLFAEWKESNSFPFIRNELKVDYVKVVVRNKYGTYKGYHKKWIPSEYSSQ